MGSSWRTRSYLILFLIFFSAYLLIPSIFNFRVLREDAEAKGDKAPWFVNLFPDKQINLGLDLQGGIYLELEVSLQQALTQRAQITVGEIERFLRDQNIPFDRVSVLPKTTTIAAFLKNPDDVVRLNNHLRDFYGESLQGAKDGPVLIYQIKPEGGKSGQDLLGELVSWSKTQQGIADVQLQEGTLEVILAKGFDKNAVRQSLGATFGNYLAELEPPAALYLNMSEIYQDRLKDETVKQAVETIRNRIDRHGVTEPSIQRLGSNRVVIEMPGVKDPDRAIALVKRAGNLEFKLVDEAIPDAQVAQLVQEARKANNLPEDFTLATVARINEALKGKIPAEDEISYETQLDPVSKKVVGGTPFLLKSKVEVSGQMLRNAQVSVQNNEPFVSLSFNPAGTKIFAEVTAANIGKRLAILLDGTVNKAPVIKSAIPSGEAQITLGYGDYPSLVREAEDLTVVLREGALPATLTEATKTVIGPSLGKSSIDKGFKATLLAGGVVMIFMAFYYKRAGMIADAALVLNMLLIFAALTLFGATLTLPGVAGIVLTIGMAVDANVIILERIKDELAAGRTIKAAVDAGYSNAMSAVIDSNVTTFLSGVVLYQFGTGPVRGFAVTLMIGIVTTLISALFFTRTYYDWRLSITKLEKLSI
jgi:protein-export membrane protein SecD